MSSWNSVGDMVDGVGRAGSAFVTDIACVAAIGEEMDRVGGNSLLTDSWLMFGGERFMREFYDLLGEALEYVEVTRKR